MLNKLRKLTKINQDAEQQNAPPGQYITEKFPVLTHGPTQYIELNEWEFRVFGLVDSEVTLDWAQFNALKQTTLDAEFHCVTQWSRLENSWEGVAFTDVDLDGLPGNPVARYMQFLNEIVRENAFGQASGDVLARLLAQIAEGARRKALEGSMELEPVPVGVQ